MPLSNLPLKNHRPIRSFVLRQSRLTVAQKNALDTYAEHYIFRFQNASHQAYLQNKPLNIPIDKQHQECIQKNLSDISDGYQRKVLEIGFGNGDSLISSCQQHPSILFVGIEVHLPGVARLIHQANKENIKNLQIIRADAQQSMQTIFPPCFFDQICIFFPDPWHKKRHHKRRLLNQPFMEHLLTCLKNTGILHIATDWQDYAQHIEEHIQAIPSLIAVNTNIHQELTQARAKTAYEKRGIKLEHTIYEIIYQKNNP